MAISIPSESKVYTTKYDTFKGVDFTNDASNVFYRRSPTGKNMLPDIDGRPYKRSGWCIEVSAAQIETLAGANIGVVPDKAYYFELGGQDYIMLFNNLGLFCYTEGVLTYINEYVDLNGDDAQFPPTGEGIGSLDSQKAFFFEGGGTAGFYLFVGNIMFMFDGTDLKEIEPKIPTTLIACDTSGAGTMLQTINMLTRKRTVQYLCDGTTSTFDIPSGVGQDDEENYLIHSVQLRSNQTGQFEDYAYYKIVSDGTQISFFTDLSLTTAYPPPVVVDGEDNMRITYSPDDSTTVTENEDVHTGWITVSATRKKTVVKTVTTRGGASFTTTNTSYSWTYSSATFETQNLKLQPDGSFGTVQGRNNGWVTMPDGLVTSSLNAYDGKITVKATKALYNSNMPTYAKESSEKTTTSTKKVQNRTTTTTITTTKKAYRTRIEYDQWVYSSNDGELANYLSAFFGTTRAMVFGNGLINQVFLTASFAENYKTRVWYSAATDPTYFPDTNYVEVGATDKPIMGLMRVGEYLGIIKQGSATETSVYLAYPTSFENETTYAVKQNVNGIGAVSNGAFNILNDEPLFLSAEGVMGIEPLENEERRIRNRSHYINKRLCAEDNLSSAISFVHEGMYWLAVNNHCYVLDGSQKSSWANTKTNLQYECYYLENIPAQCFMKYGGELWFTDFNGNLCRFKEDGNPNQYTDDYTEDGADVISNTAPVDGVFALSDLHLYDSQTDTIDTDEWTLTKYRSIIMGLYYKAVTDEQADPSEVTVKITDADGNLMGAFDPEYEITTEDNVKYLHFPGLQNDLFYIVPFGGTFTVEVTYIVGEVYTPKRGDTIEYNGSTYTITEIDGNDIYVTNGVGIEAVWGTIADDDGSAHYFKNLQKKGCMVSLLPSSDSGVEVWLKADEKEPVKIGETDAKNYELPFDFYIKKKVKKYKRLQIICKNNVIGDSFGVDQIIKSYTFGNYSKNRG